MTQWESFVVERMRGKRFGKNSVQELWIFRGLGMWGRKKKVRREKKEY